MRISKYFYDNVTAVLYSTQYIFITKGTVSGLETDIKNNYRRTFKKFTSKVHQRSGK